MNDRPDKGAPTGGADPFEIAFDAGLVEGAVLAAMERRPVQEREQFRLGRNGIYEIADPEQREDGFARFHAAWFARLGIGIPVRRAIREWPILESGIRGCHGFPARGPGEEHVDLVDSRQERRDTRLNGRPILLVRFCVSTLLDERRLIPFLRQELAHASDMLDPHFGYDRVLPSMNADSLLPDTLLRARYRVLWDVTIDGRLLARGLLSPEAKDIRLREFRATFPMLGDRNAETFRFFFELEKPTHREILDFARCPSVDSETSCKTDPDCVKVPSPG